MDELLNRDLNKIIRKLNICDKHIIQTRNQKSRSSASCRLWQFKYAVIYYFVRTSQKMNFNSGTRTSITKKTLGTPMKKTRKPKTILRKIRNNRKTRNYRNNNKSISPRIIYNMCETISVFLNLTPTSLYQELYDIVYLNKPLNTHIIESKEDLDKNLNNNLPIQNYYMCIYDPENQGVGSIIHYFTIIRDGNTYYLNSSYGSDDVCVPQYTTELDIDEFDDLCSGLPELTDTAKDLYTNYFLIKNLRKRINNNTTEAYPNLKSKWISPKQGIETELNSLVKGYHVGLIKNYETLVNDFIER
jgi:hypothetical protein